MSEVGVTLRLPQMYSVQRVKIGELKVFLAVVVASLFLKRFHSLSLGVRLFLHFLMQQQPLPGSC